MMAVGAQDSIHEFELLHLLCIFIVQKDTNMYDQFFEILFHLFPQSENGIALLMGNPDLATKHLQH